MTDTNNYRIQKFDSDGTSLVSWGSFGTGPGQFEGPTGISIDSMNNLYVVDKINNNVQKFAPIGTADEVTIPNWIKNSARWWSEGLYTDNDFVTGIKYMVKHGIIQTSSKDNSNVKIPGWFKTNVDWWTNGLVSDKEFIDGIQYLISAGIIKI